MLVRLLRSLWPWYPVLPFLQSEADVYGLWKFVARASEQPAVNSDPSSDQGCLIIKVGELWFLTIVAFSIDSLVINNPPPPPHTPPLSYVVLSPFHCFHNQKTFVSPLYPRLPWDWLFKWAKVMVRELQMSIPRAMALFGAYSAP